jgi:hypothetical protein
VILMTLDNVTQGELQRYENNYKTLNLLTTVLGRNVYDHVAHLETAHDIWLKLSLRIKILTIGNNKLFLRNLESP